MSRDSTRGDMPRQEIDQLRAEIRFREKLARQHVVGEVVLPDYYEKEEHDRILSQRVDDTRRKMHALAEAGVVLSPFIELGAERGQRSLVLVNEFDADGVAVDISYHQLRTMEHFAELFGMHRLPLRICCDATHLPFRTSSFPFAFAYQFLHHFPSPGPLMDEIHRVLSGGHFFFGEEPYRRVLKLVLYRQKRRIQAADGWRSNRYVRLIESFFSEEASDETEHGILENDEISLAGWMEALSVFDGWEANLSSIYNLTSRLHRRIAPRNLANWLLGGLIEGLCLKRGERSTRTAADSLACPDCPFEAADGRSDRPPLNRVTGGYTCASCARSYPERDGIVFLLPEAELSALYPEIAAA